MHEGLGDSKPDRKRAHHLQASTLAEFVAAVQKKGRARLPNHVTGYYSSRKIALLLHVGAPPTVTWCGLWTEPTTPTGCILAFRAEPKASRIRREAAAASRCAIL